MDGHKYTQPGVETLKLCFACTAKECILTTVMSQTGDLVIRKLTQINIHRKDDLKDFSPQGCDCMSLTYFGFISKVF